MFVVSYILVSRLDWRIKEASRRLGTHTKAVGERLGTHSWVVWGRPDTRGRLGTHSWAMWYAIFSEKWS